MGEVELKDQVRAIQAYSVRKSYSVKNMDSRQNGKKGSGLVDMKKVRMSVQLISCFEREAYFLK
jgi:hypothetical protein